MKQKKLARRVLIVCPAGLTRQWQDEMKYKFDQEYFIYGSDFFINRSEHWKQYDHVIVSLDRAKQEDHMKKFLEAGGWDIIIFDEAHKLSRYADGTRTGRYKVAESFRKMTDSFLLLTATPHQGYDDRFKSLLKLIRPDLHKEIDRLRHSPEVVSEMILRNRKSLVTNSKGELIFKGQEIKRVAVTPSMETKEFNRMLRKYLRDGYKSSERQGDKGRAIGFVMTTFRKLASSSIVSIENSLRRRLEKINDNVLGSAENVSENWTEYDIIEGGDHLDDDGILAYVDVAKFFDDEIEQITSLLSLTNIVKKNDEKLRVFLEDIVAPVFNEGKKILIFTEYRGTQSYLKNALQQRFPTNPMIAEINGSKKIEEKMEAIQKFNDSAQFMISTEAGGEGLNIQDSCHIMVNYDLPWNPARLVQRIGRLYRYGQAERVLVFNLHAVDSFDNSVIDLMLTRVDSIVDGMSPVGKEFDANFHAEVLGNILENIDMVSILRSSTDMEISRTRQEIDEAIDKANKAKSLQDELFQCVTGYNPDSMSDSIFFTMEHVNSFIYGMFLFEKIEVRKKIYSGKIYEIKLPDSLKGRFLEFGSKGVVRVTTDRNLSRKTQDIILMDFENSFFRYLIKKAKSHEFDGIYSNVRIANNDFVNLICFNLRWQNDQGKATQDEFVTIAEMKDGKMVKNPSILSELLIKKFSSSPGITITNERVEQFKNISDYADELLKQESHKFKQPNSCVAIMGSNIELDG